MCNRELWSSGVVLVCIGITFILASCFLRCASKGIEEAEGRNERLDLKRNLLGEQVPTAVQVDEPKLRQRIGERIDF